MLQHCISQNEGIRIEMDVNRNIVSVEELLSSYDFFDSNPDASVPIELYLDAFEHAKKVLNLISTSESLTTSQEARIDKVYLKVSSITTALLMKLLPWYKITKEQMNMENKDKCPICLSEWNIGDVVGKLACGHEFGLDCLNKWLTEKRNCPLCREALNVSDCLQRNVK